MRELKVTVPVLDGCPLVNAIGSNENEATVNLDSILESNEQWKRVKYIEARLVFDDDVI